MKKTNSTREQEMFRLVETALGSGFSNKTFCEQQGIDQANFYYWKKKYQQTRLEYQDKFISLQAPPTNCRTNELEICYPNGVRLRLPLGMELSVVRSFIDLL